MLRLRTYHAVLATLAVLSYLTGEVGLIHAWLGYGVTLVIMVRLAWSLTGVRQLGLEKFYPVFEGLNVFTHPAITRTLLAGIAFCLIGTTTTGILMDRGRAIGMASITSPVYADDDYGRHGRGDENEFLEGIHEFFGNLLVVTVALHVGYLLLFKRPLALFMLYICNPASRSKRRDDLSAS